MTDVKISVARYKSMIWRLQELDDDEDNLQWYEEELKRLEGEDV